MKAASPALVGSFVLGAAALAALAIVMFGGMHLFRKDIRVVVVFPESIAGLEAGAPVTFRGVRIGRVEHMKLHLDEVHHTSWVPVYLDIYVDHIVSTNGVAELTRMDLEAAVKSGLRAQLVSQSLVSGEMSVNFDYHPDQPIRRAGYAKDAFEIPTMPSDIQNLKDQLRELDLPAIGRKADRVLAAMQHMLDDLDGKIGPLSSSLQGAFVAATETVHSLQADAKKTTADIARLLNESRSQISTNGQDLDRLLRTAERATRQADSLVTSLKEMTSPNGDLQEALRDLAASADSLRGLTHDLERNPMGTLLRSGK